MIEYAGNELELTEAGVTEPVLPGDIGQVAPAVLPDLTPVPASALTVDPDSGELAAPLGVLAALASALVALAGAFGGRSVASAGVAPRQADQPVTVPAPPGAPAIA